MRQRIGLVVTIISLPLLLSGCDAAGELGMNWHGLLGQFIAFGLLLGILLLVAYKPVTRIIDERSKRIKDSMDQAEFIKEETARTEQRVQEQLTEARKQGQDIVAQAEQIGERLKEEARQQAKQDAEALVARARSEMQAESEEAIAQLRKEFVEIAIQAAEKVINKALDKEAHRQLIEQTLKESTDLKKED
ncbi:MAG TPA: F0F1 ATP synthase subunit B [Dehalococcoidia bacterium]|nr:F0F1 ATP synthase subunit B [Dehalococcoidia bacterium]